MEFSDESDVEEEQQPPLPASGKHNIDAKDTVYEVDQSGEALMPLYCLLQDYLELRLAVRCAWHTLINHEADAASDVVTSSAVTQGAFEIIHMLVFAFHER